MQIINKYPDPSKTPEGLGKLKQKLHVEIDLEAKINNILISKH